MTKSVSYIIPAFNEEKHIEKTIDAINFGAKKYKFTYEIIVVNNGSTDRTSFLAKQKNVQVFDINKSKVSTARNLGASKAKGDIFCFIDGDTVLTEEWFTTFSDSFSDIEESLIVTGAAVVIPEDNPSWIEKVWFDKSNPNPNYIGGANIITNKKTFTLIGGFDENLETGEDYEFCMRAKQKNVKLNVDKNFKAIHLGFPNNLKWFMKREIWHGKGDCTNTRSFISSKVSVFSLVYLLLSLAFLALLFLEESKLAILTLSFLFCINLFITISRTEFSFIKLIPRIILNYLYFIARSLSVFVVIYEKNFKLFR